VTNLSELTDREIVRRIKEGGDSPAAQQLIYHLYRRYDLFVHKHWGYVMRQLRGRVSSDIRDDFYSESYIAFIRALNAVSMSKIRDDNWKFLGYYGYFLLNKRKNFIKEILERRREELPLHKTKTPSDQVTGAYITEDDFHKFNVHQPVLKHTISLTRSGEELCIQKDISSKVYSAIKNCKDTVWSEEERQIFTMKERGESPSTIRSTLNMSLWKYNKAWSKIKEDLLQHLPHSVAGQFDFS
jgi:hypothetical protein